MDFINNIDFGILDFIQNYIRTDFLDDVFKVITHMGDLCIVWVILGAIMMCFKKTRKSGVMMLISALIGAVASLGIMKPLIGRLRPFEIRGITPLIPNPGGFSFPSGHTASSFAAASALFKKDKKGGTLAYILAFLIAFSRLYFFVHFPTDVFVGIIIGLGSALCGEYTVEKLKDIVKLRYTMKKVR